ncbi:recombinase family protein [Nocardia sputi]|uniref:recombinase family protein n=1 Tax=Nocardia sputi TaxID=2943705 RepID=UPI0020BEF1D7|nr:recombinase family protein [Nocardia sputi]
MPTEPNEWAVLDELLGLVPETVESAGDQRFAFYGRCSTEDNQDPETSYRWQRGNAEKFVSEASIVADYFDIGQSRSVPWHRRREAARLLADLKNPGRGWTAIVVGEGTRCWFGNQFSLVAPRLQAHGVEVWVPELGGRFDARNVTHSMMMSMLGGLSESERQHVQQRTRASMDAQVLNEGRHQGGRPPYGYMVVDGPPHPNPNRASDGLKLRILSLDVSTAPVVQRIFRDYLVGRGDKAIAIALNREGVPCPSAHRPEQNRHRAKDGWQAGTVAAILQNPRYTGYAVFGRWTKHEELLDPDDAAAGNITRFRRSPTHRIVRSKSPAHPAIISVEIFTQAQLLRRQRAGGGNRTRAKLERNRASSSLRPYLLSGLVRCTGCGRKMQAELVRDAVYYRCRAKTIAPGSPVLQDHPRTVNLREDVVVGPIDSWLASLLDRDHREKTIAALLAAQDTDDTDVQRRTLRQRITEADARLARHLAAIEAGVDPQALVTAMNAAQADKAAAQAELKSLPKINRLTENEIRKLIDSLGDIRAVLAAGDPADKARLYRALALEVCYQHQQQLAIVGATPCGVSTGVRRGSRTPELQQLCTASVHMPSPYTFLSFLASFGHVPEADARCYRFA